MNSGAFSIGRLSVQAYSPGNFDTYIHVAEMVKAQCEQICWECNNLLYGGARGASVEEDTSPPKPTNNMVTIFSGRYG